MCHHSRKSYRTHSASAGHVMLLLSPFVFLIYSNRVVLFMSEKSVLSLVSRTRLILNNTHRFLAGPYGVQAKVAEGVGM
jgi:hypothetical protein